MPEPSYSLEFSKSSRAKCKTCKNPIDKGAIRMAITFPADPDKEGSFDLSSYHHVECFKLPRKFKGQMSPAEFVDEMVTSEDPAILPKKREEIIDKIEEANAHGSPKKRVKKEHGDEEEDEEDNNLMQRVKKVAEAELKGDVKPPAKKKVKQEKGAAGETEEEFRQMVKLYKKYHKEKQDELKDILRWNKQLLMGKKEFVLFKVIDGEVHGRLGTCPLDHGTLKFDEGNYEKVHCSGKFDEEAKIKIPCNFETTRTDPNLRMQPWYTHEPSEEEKDALQKQIDEAQGNGPVAERSKEGKALMDAAEKCEWDLNSPAGLKAATKELVGLVKDKLDLPDRDLNRLLGNMVVNLKEKGATGIMEEIINKYGFKKAKEAQKEASIEALEKTCGNPKNAAMVMAFQELANYYFKDGNTNGGLAYKKSAAAIMELEVEVTPENAMSFSKGKTKVAGIGKSSAEKMKEFAETGTIEKLEEKRAAHA